MKKTLTTHEIANLLLSDEYAGWSREGAFALAEYLQEHEQETGEEMEFDAVAIRCEWNECNAKEVANDYTIDGLEDLDPEEDEEEFKKAVFEYLQDNTQVIELKDGFIFAAF